LTVSQILTWAVVHHAETGEWPTVRSGPIHGAGGTETWEAINAALSAGARGLPGGQSLAALLREYRLLPATAHDARAALSEKYTRLLRGEWKGRPPLSVEQILDWADAHRAVHGCWPRVGAGAVVGVPGEYWNGIDRALKRGFRGLPGGTTLKRLLVERRGTDARLRLSELSIAQILSWADRYHKRHGRWPSEASGPVGGGAAAGVTWGGIGHCLRVGHRGLPGGVTLRELLREHRGALPVGKAPPLCVAQILKWADEYRAARGFWPNPFSGRVDHAPGETWSGIDRSLRRGARGLPGGSSLGRLLARHRDAHHSRRSDSLTVGRILEWADAHHAATGQWPTLTSGPVLAAPGVHWSTIDAALRKGLRGLPGGISLRHLLREHGRLEKRDLTIKTILAWADAHHAQTGHWPGRHSGHVIAAPGEKWANIDQALMEGRRGLPAGSSLAKLLAGRKDPERAIFRRVT
jgi:hypothetical protein